jgi:hypothetical protein
MQPQVCADVIEIPGSQALHCWRIVNNQGCCNAKNGRAFFFVVAPWQFQALVAPCFSRLACPWKF